MRRKWGLIWSIRSLMDRKKWSLGYMSGVRKRKSFKARARSYILIKIMKASFLEHWWIVYNKHSTGTYIKSVNRFNQRLKYEGAMVLCNSVYTSQMKEFTIRHLVGTCYLHSIVYGIWVVRLQLVKITIIYRQNNPMHINYSRHFNSYLFLGGMCTEAHTQTRSQEGAALCLEI